MAKKPSVKSTGSKSTTRSTSQKSTTKPTPKGKQPEISFGRTGVIDFGVDPTKKRKTPRG